MSWKTIITTGVLTLTLTACTSESFNNAVVSGKEYAEKKDYVKAAAAFELALKEKKDTDVQGFLQQVEDMQKAVKLMEEGKYEEALTLLDKVKERKNVLGSIKANVTKLEGELQAKQQKMEKINADIQSASGLLQQKKWQDTITLLEGIIQSLQKDTGLQSQQQQASNLLAQAKDGLTKQKEAEAEQQRKREYEKSRLYINERYRFSIEFPDKWVQKYRVIEDERDYADAMFTFQYRLSTGKYHDLFYIQVTNSEEVVAAEEAGMADWLGNNRGEDFLFMTIKEVNQNLNEAEVKELQQQGEYIEKIIYDIFQIYVLPAQGVEDDFESLLKERKEAGLY